MRYLDPKNDLTFKKVFGEHPHLLKSLLNALLPLNDDEQIVSLEYLPAELMPCIPLKKNTVVDVRCVDKHGRQFVVEMQMLWTDSFMSRVLFNSSKAYVKQLDKGEDYKSLQPVYALNFIDDTFDPDPKVFYHHYQIVNIQNTNKQLKGLEFVFVELPKFRPQTINQKKLQVLWLRFLTEIKDSTTTINEELMQNPELREAIEYLQESAFTQTELYAYDKYWDMIRVERTIIEDSLSKGKMEGKMEGKLEGKMEGKMESKIEMALIMIAASEANEKINQYTGLSFEKIDELRK